MSVVYIFVFFFFSLPFVAIVKTDIISERVLLIDYFFTPSRPLVCVRVRLLSGWGWGVVAFPPLLLLGKFLVTLRKNPLHSKKMCFLKKNVGAVSAKRSFFLTLIPSNISSEYCLPETWV